jgi:hypothetical protein
MDRAEVREKIWRTIEHKWDRRRPPGGVGTTDSKTVYDRLVAKGGRRTTRRNGWDFAAPTRRGAYQRAPLYGRRGIQLHGGWTIVEPEWRRYEP